MSRTPLDYQSDLIRIFGEVPSPAKLASMENAAMRESLGYGYSNCHRAYSVKEVMANPSDARVIDALRDGPLNGQEIVRSTGIPKSTVQKCIMRAKSAGMVVIAERTRNFVRWGLAE